MTTADPLADSSVYVSGLPTDTDEEELVQVFSRCGVVREHPDTGKKHVKLYGHNDALVVYLRKASVQLAIDVLDDTPLRLGDGQPMRVSQADFSHKKEEKRHKKRKRSSSTAAANNDEDASAESKRKRQRYMHAQRQALRTLGWGEGEEGEEENEDPALQLSEEERAADIANRTVVLTHMFTLDEMASSPVFKQELELDVAEECARLGELEHVQAHSTNADGVVEVRFKSADASRGCVNRMKGRFYAGRQIDACIWDGQTKLDPEETPEEQEARLEQFGRELEGGDAADDDREHDENVEGVGRNSVAAALDSEEEEEAAATNDAAR